MVKQQEEQNTNCNCSVGDLQRLKDNWQKTNNEQDKEKYFEALKHCNSKLIVDDEI